MGTWEEGRWEEGRLEEEFQEKFSKKKRKNEISTKCCSMIKKIYTWGWGDGEDKIRKKQWLGIYIYKRTRSKVIVGKQTKIFKNIPRHPSCNSNANQ
uniref:Uncharacterized protein n=1 Tax=Arion vulgaris TaxID=1028688 RepID=A0A0B6XYZ2_9EUPU